MRGSICYHTGVTQRNDEREGDEMAIYHVTQSWDGGDLRSLARQMDDGDLSLDAGLEQIVGRWGDLTNAERYLDTDGHQVHCHATLAAAVEYRDEFCLGGEILEIDASSLAVLEGAEYPHPVVADMIPADAIRVAVVA